MRRLDWPLREDACLFAEALRAAPERTEELERPVFESARRPTSEADPDFRDLTFDLALRLLLALTGLRRTLLSLFFLPPDEDSDISESDADADLAEVDLDDADFNDDGLRLLRLLSDEILSGIKSPFFVRLS